MKRQSFPIPTSHPAKQLVWLRLLGTVLMFASFAHSQDLEQVVTRFTMPNPKGGLIIDANGVLYGAVHSFTSPHGNVYELRHLADGRWIRTTLYSFTGGTDGAYPNGNLILGQDGKLYGTTTWGGATGNGVVFELTPTAAPPWTENVIYSFTNFPDGSGVSAGLIADAAGNFYGTTAFGGVGHGTIFRLKHNPDGTWTESVLYRFTGGTDGNGPQDGLAIDSAGNIFGTTEVGGVQNSGTLYELSPGANDTWNFRVLHTFCEQTNCTDGQGPMGVTVDDQGNLYGTTNAGGIVPCSAWSFGCGVAYQYALGQNGAATFQILHTFCSPGSCLDGARPATPVTLDKAGTLYGTTSVGGNANQGTIFKLSHPVGSPWVLDSLYSFCAIPQCVDGLNPTGPLTIDAAGNLFGPAYNLIFELTNSSSTTLASDLNPSIYGQKITFSATVSSTTSQIPTGKVVFKSSQLGSAVTFGTSTLNSSGVATLTKSLLNAGYSYPVTAVYFGDALHVGSSSQTLTQTVTQAASQTSITSSPNPSSGGQVITFTATVTSTTVVPTGPVTFSAGKQVLGSAQIVPSTHKATFSTSTLPVGSTPITATYSGNSNVAASSASLVQTVH
jgi:uncharacterized repeat protein (TIGR03803 family)